MPISRHTTTRSLAAMAMASALTLTACGSAEEEKAADDGQKQEQERQGSSSEPGAEGGSQSAGAASDASESEEPELIEELEPEVAAELSGIPDELDLEDVEKSKDNLVEVFGAHYTVEQVAKTEALPKDLAEQVGGGTQEYAEQVKAAEGEAFYVAVLTADDPRHDYDGNADAPEITTGYRTDGNPIEGMSLPDIQVGDTKAVVVSADADAEPEDVTFEIEQDSVSQELSLVDGSRTHSDVEEIYERGTEVEVGDPSTWEVTAEHERHSATTVSGEVDGGVVLPAHPEHGWPGKGKVFLGLDISATEPDDIFYDSTQAVLEFEDGTTARWEEEPHGYPRAFEDRVWFEVPADTEEAELQLDVQIQISTEKNKSLKDVTVPLTISGELGEDSEAGDSEKSEGSTETKDSDEAEGSDEAKDSDETKDSDESEGSDEAEGSETESAEASASEEPEESASAEKSESDESGSASESDDS